MGSSGGGAGSGSIKYPPYLEQVHSRFLINQPRKEEEAFTNFRYPMYEVAEAALGPGGNPFEYIASFNPGESLLQIDDKITEFMQYVATFEDSPQAQWDAFFNAAVLKVNEALADGVLTFDSVTVDDYEEDALPSFLRSVNRFAGGMADINAVQSSSFTVGLAVLEREYQQEVGKFRRATMLEYRQQIMQLIFNAVNQMIESQKTQALVREDLAKLWFEYNKTVIVAMQDYHNAEATITTSQAQWDLEIFQHVGNFISAIGGGNVVTKSKGGGGGSSMGQSMGMILGGVGGFIAGGGPAGAAIGAQIGGQFGGVVGDAVSQ